MMLLLWYCYCTVSYCMSHTFLNGYFQILKERAIVHSFFIHSHCQSTTLPTPFVETTTPSLTRATPFVETPTSFHCHSLCRERQCCSW
jgi:hypothetical protein